MTYIRAVRLNVMDSNKKLFSSRRNFSSRSGWTNKYVLSVCLLLIWVAFFDKHRVFTQYKLSQTIHRLEDERAFYIDKIEEAKLDRVDIEKNKEKYARERFYMHKADEEVFIIEQ